MSETLDRTPAGVASPLPGATIIGRIRGMLLSALGAALGYSILGTASKRGCFDAVSEEAAADSACVNLTLHPSPIVFIAIAVTVIVAITLVLRPGRSEASALRIIDRAVDIIIAGTLAWAALTMVSFFAIPLEPPGPGEPFTIPFTFGNVDIDITP